MLILTDSQHTDEWFAAREGRLTASNFAEAVGMIGSRKRLWRVLTKREAPRRQNDAMKRGTLLEPAARLVYATTLDINVSSVGLVTSSDVDEQWLGASPDGLCFCDEAPRWDLGSLGTLEIKCPEKMYDTIPEYYMPQIQGVMHLTDRGWCDFVAYTESEARVWRVLRDRQYWDELYAHLSVFWSFVEAGVEPPTFKRGSKPRISATPVVAQPVILFKDENHACAV